MSASSAAPPLTAVPFHAVTPKWMAPPDAGSEGAASKLDAAASAPRVPPDEPLGSVLSNAPTTSSSKVADADAAIVAVRPKLRACYLAARGNGPEIVGMVTCGVRIDRAGKVVAVGITRRNSLPAPLVECIVRELKMAIFAPRADEAVIMVPVRFGTLPDG